MALHEISQDVAASICCVSTDYLDYISKALKLGRDKPYRQKVSSAIKQRNHRIYDDSQTAFEWARFLCRALGVVLDNTAKDIVAGEMNYIPEAWQEDSFVQNEFIKMQQKWKSARLEQALLR